MTMARNLTFLAAFLTAIVLLCLGHPQECLIAFVIAVGSVWK